MLTNEQFTCLAKKYIDTILSLKLMVWRKRTMSNESNIDPRKLNAMKVKILRAEQENLRTREKTSEQMVDHIRKIIAHEAKKSF